MPVFLAWLRNGNLKLWDIHLHREVIQEQLLNQIWEVVVLVGPHKHSVLVMLPSRRRESLEQAAGISRECRIKMWKTRGAKKGIIMGDEVKQKSKGKEVMDERHIIKKQPDKVQHTRLLLLHFFYSHTSHFLKHLCFCHCFFIFFLALHIDFFYTFFHVQGLEEKGIS